MASKFSKIGRARTVFLAVIASLGFSHMRAAEQDAVKLASANAAFGFNLMKQVVQEQPEANVFVSPYSISAALQMLWQGSGGETKKEMAQVFGFNELKADAFGRAYKELDDSLKKAES